MFSRLGRRIAFALGATLIAAQGLLAGSQSPPASAAALPSTGLILGTVVDAGTNKGIPGAVVSMNFTGAPPPGAPPGGIRGQVIADDQGRFVFRDLPGGRYSFIAYGEGYASGSYGARKPSSAQGLGQFFELAEGAKVRDLSIRLWKFASISGKVVDDLGDPLIGATVGIYAREFVAGRLNYRYVINPPETDDRGIYRASSLIAGDYVVGILISTSTMPMTTREAYDTATGSARTDLTNQLGGAISLEMMTGGLSGTYRIGDLTLQGNARGVRLPPPGSDGRLSVYPTTFHPASPTLATAAVITVASGEDRKGVDLTLRLRPSVSVSGSLMGLSGPAVNQSLTLVRQGPRQSTRPELSTVSSTVSDAAGHFTFLGILPGSYTIEASLIPRAASTMTSTSVVVETPTGTRTMGTGRSSGPAPLPTDPALFASRDLTVGDTNVANVDLQFRAAGKMTGTVAFVGTRERPTADALARLMLSFDSGDGRLSTQLPRAQIDLAGTFSTTSFVPGRYYLRPTGQLAGWYLTSAMYQGHNVLDEPFDADGSDISGVVLTFSDRLAQLTGNVRDEQSRPTGIGTVLLFTANRAVWGNGAPNLRTMRAIRTSSNGAYTTGNTPVPPGDYFVIAADDAVVADWQDPKQLESASRSATRVTIGEGESRVLDLKVAVIK